MSRYDDDMQRLISVFIVAALCWYAYMKYQDQSKPQRVVDADVPSQMRVLQAPTIEVPTTAAFKCDGRTHCSQMTSCAEATFFLRNCPGTKMDGDNDGTPCETQWCK